MDSTSCVLLVFSSLVITQLAASQERYANLSTAKGILCSDFFGSSVYALILWLWNRHD